MPSSLSSFFYTAQDQVHWPAVEGVVLASVFFALGVWRVVEITNVQFSTFQRRIFIPIHIVGCFLFSAVMALILADNHGTYKHLTNSLFCAGMALLFPLHIYVGLKRRMIYRQIHGLD